MSMTPFIYSLRFQSSTGLIKSFSALHAAKGNFQSTVWLRRESWAGLWGVPRNVLFTLTRLSPRLGSPVYSYFRVTVNQSQTRRRERAVRGGHSAGLGRTPQRTSRENWKSHEDLELLKPQGRPFSRSRRPGVEVLLRWRRMSVHAARVIRKDCVVSQEEVWGEAGHMLEFREKMSILRDIYEKEWVSFVLWPVPVHGALHLPATMGCVCTSLCTNKLTRLWGVYYLRGAVLNWKTL